MTSSPFSPGDVIAGKYRVERVLGQGGMGVVLAALQLELKRRVALKFILPGALSRPQAEGRFVREARAAAALSSEHSVRIFDFGRLDDGAAFLVMEYLEGTDLAALLTRDGPLNVALAVEYVLQAAVGLAEAHARGIVHRDIKPQNLFLTTSASGEPLVKVLDFGVSKVSTAFSGFDATKSGAMLGSPGYMAPEQMRAAHEVDARADIWALGCTLYNLLTGSDAFEAGSLAELCAQVLHGEPRSIEELRQVPSGLAACVRRCLAKDPAERPQHLGVLADDLARFAGARGQQLRAKVRGALGSAALDLASAPAPAAVETAWGRRSLLSALALAVAAAAVVAFHVLPAASNSATAPVSTPAPPVLPSPAQPNLLPTPASALPPAPAAPARALAAVEDAGLAAPGIAQGAASGGNVSSARRVRSRPLSADAIAQPAQESARAAGVEPAPAALSSEAPAAEPAPDQERDPRLMRH